MAKRYSRYGVDDILDSVAAEHGLPARLFRTFAKIESGMRPWVQTGSYKGLFQLSNKEFRKHGSGDIWDPRENANAFANLLKANIRKWSKDMGRAPTESEMYLMHQQGSAGAKAHLANPDSPAWQSIRQYYGSDRIAKKAIWGNVPTQYKKAFGSVDNITSRQFVQMWADRVTGGAEDREVSLAQGGVPEMPSRGAWDMADNTRREPPQDDRIKFGGAPINAETGEPYENPPEAVAALQRRRASADARVASSSPQGAGEASAAGVSPNNTEWLDQAFGKPFGELYQNDATPQGGTVADLKLPDWLGLKEPKNTQLGQGILGKALGIPPQPPLFRQLFPGLYTG